MTNFEKRRKKEEEKDDNNLEAEKYFAVFYYVGRIIEVKAVTFLTENLK